MIRMMDEIERYTELINSGLASERDVEEVRHLVQISSTILFWFEDQEKQINSVRYDPDTGFLEFEMQNTSGLDFKELEFDILAEESLYTVSFQNWMDEECRKVQFTHFYESTNDMSITLQVNSTAFELFDGTGKEEEVAKDETGEDGSYPVKIPLGNWILKEGEDGNKEVVPLKELFEEDNENELGEDEDTSYSVDVTGIVEHILKALVPEESNKEDDGEEADDQEARLEKARREVLMQCKFAKNGERPSVEDLTAYLKYLGYDDDEIKYALKVLDEETDD